MTRPLPRAPSTPHYGNDRALSRVYAWKERAVIDDVYNGRILDLASRTPAPGSLDGADASVTKVSKLCGSQLRADIAMDGDRVRDIAMEVKACALGQAAATVVYENAVGATATEISSACATMHAMLKENGPPPDGRFGELKYLEPVKDYRARHASTLLAIDALAEAVERATERAAAA